MYTLDYPNTKRVWFNLRAARAARKLNLPLPHAQGVLAPVFQGQDTRGSLAQYINNKRTMERGGAIPHQLTRVHRRIDTGIKIEIGYHGAAFNQ